jgi:maltose alpha-D-glucosyltransferase/alpha-amylase
MSSSDTSARPYPAWLDDAVFYEIYPQTFIDSNGDGIGDLPGVISKLDYLSSLGITGIWLNPCWESPFQDAGYDVSDFYKVAARYGTNEDLRRLIEEAGRRGIHIMLDLVPGHTSWDHPWFKASSKHGRNEYSDWYIWTNSVWQQADGLQRVSGLVERDASYITNFFVFQPALNYGFAAPDPEVGWQQPVDAPGPQAVRQEIRNILRFWLDMGVSGFRVDMAFSLVKKDVGHHETIRFWREVSAWLDQDYPEVALVSEWGNPTEAIHAGFHMDFLLHFHGNAYMSLFRKNANDPYGWSVFDRSGHGNFREFIDDYMRYYAAIQGKGMMSLITGNHDIPQRLAEGRDTDDLACAFLFLLTMPGVPFIYYGDEIGMRTVYGLPSKEGGFKRTGARTPMQWDGSPNAGFSTAAEHDLYLPIDPRENRPTVADQEGDPHSLLKRVRTMIALRRAHAALRAEGGFAPIATDAGCYPIVYLRSAGDQRLLVAVNPTGEPAEVELPAGLVKTLAHTLYGHDGAFVRCGNKWSLRLPAVSGGVYEIG